MKTNKDNYIYTSCGSYLIRFDHFRKCFSVFYQGNEILQDVQLVCNNLLLSTYPEPCVRHVNLSFDKYDCYDRMVEFSFHAEDFPEIVITCKVNLNDVCFSTNIGFWRASIHWGKNMEQETFAVSLQEDMPFLRGAVGPATSSLDHALLDRQSGQILSFSPNSVRLQYSFEKNCYQVDSLNGQLTFSIIKDFYEQKYGISYTPINENNIAKSPNVGVGTYYAFLMDFDEHDLCDVIALQQMKLKDFGANTVLVDFEWVRNDTSGSRDFPFDHFAPDSVRYPSGLAATAKRIKEAGFSPILWIGITCEHKLNAKLEEHSEVILADDPTSWCGKYYVDPTHPYFTNEYLPQFLKQVKDWGYDGIKWDLLCETYDICEKYHSSLYSPEKTSSSIMRSIFQKARDELGPNYHMTQCAAPGIIDLSMGADIFDAVRIGRDVWSWNNVKTQVFDKLCTHYPLHNVLTFCDPDHVIISDNRVLAADTCLSDASVRIRTTISTEEAITRLTPVSMLGLPFNIGDDLRRLSSERMDMMRKCLPVADVHPQNLGFTKKQEIVPICVNICKPFGSWTVFSVSNTTECATVHTYDLQKDLGLAAGSYLLYDFWNDDFLGFSSNLLSLELQPHQTRNISIRKCTGYPQVVTSSRHILQGAVEIIGEIWKNNVLHIRTQCVADYDYNIKVFVPDTYICNDPAISQSESIHSGRLITLTPQSQNNGQDIFDISFQFFS